MFLLPKTIGAFTLHRKLGSGGVAETYVGTQEGSSGKAVVVRRILPFVLRDASRLASIEARVEDLKGIRHPFLVQVLDHVAEGDEHFVVEEFVDGVTMDRVLSWCKQTGRALPHNVFLNIATQICNGLEALHAREGKVTHADNVLHLALKPGAVFITREGRVVLGSYGLTRSPTTLPSGGVSGPVPTRMEYLSPEQTHNDQKLSPSSDIFSLAAVLFEFLTQESLFRAESNLQTIHRVRKAEVAQALGQVRDRLPGLEKVLFRALALNPKHRYQRAFVLREDLRGLMAGYSFANIGEDTRAFVAPLFETLADIGSDPLGSSPTAVPGGDDFAENPSTTIDPDPAWTARGTAQAHAMRVSETRTLDEYGPSEHGENTENMPGDAADPVTSVQPSPAPAPADELDRPTLAGVDRPSDMDPPTSIQHDGHPETTDAIVASFQPAQEGAADTAAWLAAVGGIAVPASSALAGMKQVAGGEAVDSTAGFLAAEGVSHEPPPEEPENTNRHLVRAISLQPLAVEEQADAKGPDPTSSSGDIRHGLAAPRVAQPPMIAPPTDPTPLEPAEYPPPPPKPLSRAMPPPSVGRTADGIAQESKPVVVTPRTPSAAAPPPPPSADDMLAPPPPARPTGLIVGGIAAGLAFVAVIVCAGGGFGLTQLWSSKPDLAQLEPPKVEPTTEEPVAAEPPAAAVAAVEPAKPVEPAPPLPAAEPEPEPAAVVTPPPAQPKPEAVVADAAPVRTRTPAPEPVTVEPTRTRTPSTAAVAVVTPRPTPTPAPTKASTARTTTPEPTPEAVLEPVAEPSVDVASWSDSARSGRLGDDGVSALESVPAGDANYTRARTLLLMNAQKRGDSKATRAYLDDLMGLPENRYNPVLLTDYARYNVNRGEYSKAIEQASLAERNWARLPSELVFTKKAEIYEIQAAAYQGRFYKNSEDAELLENAVRYWTKYRDHVSTKGRSDLAKKADAELEKLADIKEKLK